MYISYPRESAVRVFILLYQSKIGKCVSWFRSISVGFPIILNYSSQTLVVLYYLWMVEIFVLSTILKSYLLGLSPLNMHIFVCICWENLKAKRVLVFQLQRKPWPFGDYNRCHQILIRLNY